MKTYVDQMIGVYELDDSNPDMMSLVEAFMEIERNDLLVKEVFLSSQTKNLLMKMLTNSGCFKGYDHNNRLETAQYKIDDSIKYKILVLVSQNDHELRMNKIIPRQ